MNSPGKPLAAMQNKTGDVRGDPGKSFLFFLMVISSNLRGHSQASSSLTGGGSLAVSSGHGPLNQIIWRNGPIPSIRAL